MVGLIDWIKRNQSIKPTQWWFQSIYELINRLKLSSLSLFGRLYEFRLFKKIKVKLNKNNESRYYEHSQA